MSENKPAIKHDEGKIPVQLLPFDSLFEISKVLGHGAEKYEPRNWERGLEWDRIFRATLTHLWLWWMKADVGKGPGIDESGFSHLTHAGCNILFLIAHEKRKIGEDNRP